MPIKKRKVWVLLLVVVLFNGLSSFGTYAEDGLLERCFRAKSLYSAEEMKLLDEKAETIRNDYQGITPLGVERIINKRMNFKFDTPPVIINGRTLVPVRAISEAFEASVGWDPVERQVTVRKGETEILIWIDESLVMVDGEKKIIDVPAMVLNARTMVPLRFICESLGLTIVYHESYGVVEMLE